MEKYIVEFASVFADSKETWERDKLDQRNENLGMAPPEYNSTHDYISKVGIDISQVSGYDVGSVYHNEEKLNCVYAEFKVSGGNYYSRNLLIKLEEFKAIFEFVHNIKIELASETLKRIQNGSN